MEATEIEKRNNRRGWFVAITAMCLFLISSAFVSCWEKPEPLEMPGEILIALGNTSIGSSEAGAPTPVTSEAPKPQEVTEPASQEDVNALDDPDSDAIPEEITSNQEEPKKIVSPKDNTPTKEELEKKKNEEIEKQAKIEAEREAKEKADKIAQDKADKKAKEEADRLAKIEAQRKADEEAAAALAGGSGGSSSTAGNQGSPNGTQNGGSGGSGGGTEKGSPSGWKKDGKLADHLNITVQPGRDAKVTIKYTIDSNGNIKTANITKAIGITSSSDQAIILSEFKKLKFKPINAANVSPGDISSAIYIWNLKSK